jgi:hypothetical protein
MDMLFLATIDRSIRFWGFSVRGVWHPGPGGCTFIMMRSCVSFLYNKIQLKTYMHYELEIAKHLNRGTKSVEGSQKCKNISVLLVEETGVSEKTTDISQVPCKRCIENTFLERDFNSQL